MHHIEVHGQEPGSDNFDDNNNNNNNNKKYPESYRFVSKWGSQTNNAVLYASKITTDRIGNLYVVVGGLDLTPVNGRNAKHLMIVKYDSSGYPLIQFGPYGEGIGELDSPAGIAVDPYGKYVFVSDSAGKILKFNGSDGSFMKQWGRVGTGDGELSQFVQGLAVDSEGNVYVADAGNAQIQKFSSDGEFISRWGSDGSQDGQFAFPYGIAIGPDGSIYVDDLGNRRIQKFNSESEFLLKWSISLSPGIGDPVGIAVDSEGSVFIVPQSTGQVKKYTSDGQFVSAFNGTILEPAELYAPTDVAVDGNGNIYTALQNGGVQKFDGSGSYILSIVSTKVGVNGFRSPMGIAVDTDGHVYVMDDVDMRVQKFSSNGEYISQWQFANSPGENAYDVAADSRGKIYVLSAGVKVFSSERGEQIGSLKDESGDEVIGANAITIDDRFVYVASSYKVQKFTLDGKYVSEWRVGDTGEITGNNVFVDDIAVDSEGRIYTLGFFTNVVEVFDGQGMLLKNLDFSSDTPTINGQQHANAFRINIDEDDRLYVAYADGTISSYDLNGNFVAQVASRGSGDGQVVFPTGIAFNDQSGQIYVLDHGNYRVQVFERHVRDKVPQQQESSSSLPQTMQIGSEAMLIFTVVAAVAAATIAVAGGGLAAKRYLRLRKQKCT
ncbi:MAG TPA: hypothetical protein VJP79_07925 [Nitrososphaera sp.]|nr:hypothetical protein [Nitrososphaera sp.]